MLRSALFAIALLAAATPVALTYAAASETAAPRDPSTFPPYTEIVLDHSSLPSPTGWFAVPIASAEDAWVRVDMDLQGANDQTRQLILAMPIVALTGYGAGGPLFGHAAVETPVNVAHRGGTLFACCDLAMGWSSFDAGMEVPFLLPAGQTLWVGLATYNWPLDHSFYARISAQSVLTAGETLTGTRVEAVDLAREALEAGTRVRALNHVVQPSTGAAERAWTSEAFGMFAFRAHAWEDSGASAEVSLSVPGLAAVSRGVTEEGIGAGAHRAGTYSVRLDEVEVPVVSHQPFGLEAIVMFADIDVPGDVAFIYP